MAPMMMMIVIKNNKGAYVPRGKVNNNSYNN